MYKVLIVDDERIVKLAVKSMIQWQELGLELAGTASNGISALQAIEKSRPDIIVTDIKMPVMDGVELIKKLREMEYDGEILVLSNYNDFELVREALRYGAYDYVLKVTVKSEDFSKLLKEVVLKLERKKGGFRVHTEREINSTIKRDHLLGQVSDLSRSDFHKEVQELTGLCAIGSGEGLHTFILKAEEPSAIQVPLQLSEAIRSIAEEFLANSIWYSVLELEKNAVLFTILYRLDNMNFSPESMAERLAELTGTYFNIRVGLIYSEPAAHYGQYFEFAGRCIRVSELFFYSRYGGKVLPMSYSVTEDEACLDNMVRRASSHIYDEFLENRPERILDELKTVVDAAAEYCLSPYRLKKSIKKLLREAERNLYLNGYCGEEIFDLYADDEDVIYSAGTQGKLMKVLEDLLRKAQEQISTDILHYRKEVRRAVEYIEKHAIERISLSDVAKYVSLNDTYLCKIFKEDTGKSIVSYINELKMKIAYGMLNKGDMMIKEAAASVGIDDPFYFNRLFKKFYGITPKEIKSRS